MYSYRQRQISQSDCKISNSCGKNPFCFSPPKDIEDPSFGETCPSPRKTYADKGKTTTLEIWGPVTATDNSDEVNVTVSPQVTSPHMFSEGQHTVVYTATDPSGNKKLCYFKVTVQGKNQDKRKLLKPLGLYMKEEAKFSVSF